MFVYDCVFVVWNMWVENEFGHAESIYRNWKNLHMWTVALFVILQRALVYIIMTLACERKCCVDVKTGTCDINKQTLFHTSHVI